MRLAICIMAFCLWAAGTLYPVGNATAAPGEPLNIHIAFAWLDGRNCPGCTILRLRLLVDEQRLFASSVMLQDYADLASSRQRAIEVDKSGAWKCANHTQGPSAPDPRLRGVNYEVCVRLISRSGNRFSLGHILRIKSPPPESKYTIITDATFSVDVVGQTSCRAQLLSAKTTYQAMPGVAVPASSIREQACNFVQ